MDEFTEIMLKEWGFEELVSSIKGKTYTRLLIYTVNN